MRECDEDEGKPLQRRSSEGFAKRAYQIGPDAVRRASKSENAFSEAVLTIRSNSLMNNPG
jgi:hypothetical protein